jgi:DNA polymerase-1
MTDQPRKRLFLLDAYGLIFRAYYAFIKNPRITSSGINTSAVFGFLLTLQEVLQKQKPTHIAVVFDNAQPTFRHEMFSGYKATRNETPEDIRNAIPHIKRLLEAFNIPIFDCPGFEADDLIGTLARLACEHGFETFMMTSDKDFSQLVNDCVFIFKPSRSGNESVMLGVEDVKKIFGVSRPEQVIDVLALTGDTSDNIPGAPGIGPKTAMKLIAEFGSIEELFKHTHKLKGKIKDIIEANREQIEFSRKLVTIDQYSPVSFSEEYLELKSPDREKLKAIFSELEFTNLGAKILSDLEGPAKAAESKETLFQPEPASMQGTLFDTGSGENVPAKKSIANTEHKYDLAYTEESVKKLAEELQVLPEFCFYTAATGLNALDSELVGIAFSWQEGTGCMIWFPESRHETEKLLGIIRHVFENPSIRKTGYNLKFDIQLLATYGVSVNGRLFDIMLAHYLLEPDLRHGISVLAETYLSYNMSDIGDLIGEKTAGTGNMRAAGPEKLRDYLVENADIAWQLEKVFEPKLKEQGLEKLSEEIEMPLIRVLAGMERNGVILDMESLGSITAELRNDIISLENEIYTLAGTEFNISSPKQLGDILFLKLKLDEKARVTKTKQFNTGEEILQKLSGKHPIIDKVLEYRGLKKLLTTYVEALPLLINPHTGRIHTSFNQAVAATGRLSSNNPNLQNIPVRDERGREIRRAFVPSKGHIFLSADYSQIELRLMAHLSGDSNMIAAFRSADDIHAATAARIFGVELSEVTREMRSRAKTANFGIIYGISVFGLSERLNIPRKEAKELIDGYFNSYPAIRAYMDESIRKARETGYVTTMFGRRRYVRDINSRNAVVRGFAERNAINAPIQGSAADLIKIAMIRIHERLIAEKLASKMILQVHDELIFEVPEGELERLRDIVVHEMSDAVRLDVPVTVEWGTGKNWLEAH